MGEDAAFLERIQTDPHDLTLRLVYADWLEEQGDPRGGLVRIEEEMRQLPVFGDRFWDLKPIRNELRVKASAEWLEQMGYGRVCQPVFRHGWPDGVTERWRVIREFVERWQGIPLPDVGGHIDVIREVESRLGRTLPLSLREWVAFANDVGFLHDRYTMQMIDDHQALSVLWSEEGELGWEVRLQNLDLIDPPVYGFIGDPLATKESVDRELTANRLTEFVLVYSVSLLMHPGSAGGQFWANLDGTDFLNSALKTSFPGHCQIDATNVYFLINYINLFELNDILVAIEHNHLGEVEHHRMRVYFSRPLPD